VHKPASALARPLTRPLACPATPHRTTHGRPPCSAVRVTASPATFEGGRCAKLPLPTLMPSNIIITEGKGSQRQGALHVCARQGNARQGRQQATWHAQMHPHTKVRLASLDRHFSAG